MIGYVCRMCAKHWKFEKEIENPHCPYCGSTYVLSGAKDLTDGKEGIKVTIMLNGCDDSTEFLAMVTQEQLNFLKDLETITNELGGGCQPTLEVSEVNK